jgi:hypothetical protein
MNYFFITDDEVLIPLSSFAFTEGQSRVVSIPVFGGAVYGRTRKEADTFRMVAASILPQAGGFRVVDENCTVYECMGANVSVTNGRLVVSGIVHSRWDVEPQHQAEARQKMQQAIGN